MKESSVVGTSVWTKGDKKCVVHSFRETKNGRRNPFWKVTFTGWNPFPCYRMETSIGVLFAWLKVNGWTQEPGGVREYSELEYDEHTGECLSDKHWRTVYVPVKETTEEPAKGTAEDLVDKLTKMCF